MALEINIPSKLERALVAEATRRGVSPTSIVVEALERELPSKQNTLSPKDMVAEWRQQAVLGTFADRTDSIELARELRRESEHRA